MSGWMIDREKLANQISNGEKIRNEAFAEFGMAYVYRGASASHTKDRKTHACLMAGCVDGLKDIMRDFDIYTAQGGKDLFALAHDRAGMRINQYEPNTRGYFLAQGVEMAYRTVLNSCLARTVEYEHAEQFTLQYLNKAGDVIARDYFKSLLDARQMAMQLLDTYRENGSESVKTLCIEDQHGREVVTYEVLSDKETHSLADKIKLAEGKKNNDAPNTSARQKEIDRD